MKLKIKNILRTATDGFSMAIADSVPGVSGGTVAFMLGFYERLIVSMDNMFSRNTVLQKKGFTYLLNLGLGWVLGFSTCVLLLSWLFEKNVFFISSLFLGLTMGAVPCIAMAEKSIMKPVTTHGIYSVMGFALVATVSILSAGAEPMSMASFGEVKAANVVYLFVLGIVALSAMILPGMSGTTILLIGGVYVPTIRGVKCLINLDMSYLPGLVSIGLGLAVGMVVVVPLIRKQLRKNRSQMIYFILGMTLGSVVSIIMGPKTLDGNLEPLNLGTFSIYGFTIGVALIAILEVVKGHHSK